MEAKKEQKGCIYILMESIIQNRPPFNASHIAIGAHNFRTRAQVKRWSLNSTDEVSEPYWYDGNNDVYPWSAADKLGYYPSRHC